MMHRLLDILDKIKLLPLSVGSSTGRTWSTRSASMCMIVTFVSASRTQHTVSMVCFNPYLFLMEDGNQSQLISLWTYLLLEDLMQSSSLSTVSPSSQCAFRARRTLMLLLQLD